MTRVQLVEKRVPTITLSISWLEHCNRCGCETANVETTEGCESFLFDGDKLTCPSCGNTGLIAVTDDYADDSVAYAVWDNAVAKHIEFETIVLP